MNQHVTPENVDATLKILQSLASSKDEVANITSGINAAIGGRNPEASFMALLKIISEITQYRMSGVPQKAATLCLMSTAANLSVDVGITEEEFACVQVLA